jgi:hypothetical protein
MWHYSDFAQTTRAGADTARRLRRKVDDILGLLHPILTAAKKTSDSSVALYQRLIRADVVIEGMTLADEDLFAIRDNELHDELEAFFAAVAGRVRGGHMNLIPTLDRGDLAVPESPGRKDLAKLVYAIGELDIPACKRISQRLESLSSWSGMARNRLATRRNTRARVGLRSLRL